MPILRFSQTFSGKFKGGRAASILLLNVSIIALTGCGYTLHGRVVEGAWSHISVTGPGEAETAASGAGLGGAQITVYRDPGRPSQQRVASGVTSADGSFAIPLSGAFGAGWMEEVWLIQATRAGYVSVEEILTLPMNSKARPVSVTMTRGRSTPFAPPDDYQRDLERFR